MKKWIHPDSKKRTINPLLGCWLYNSAATNTGYKSIRTWMNRQFSDKMYTRNTEQNFLVHHIAFLYGNGRDIRPGFESSHLCSTRACFNPDCIQKQELCGYSRHRAYWLGKRFKTPDKRSQNKPCMPPTFLTGEKRGAAPCALQVGPLLRRVFPG